MKKETYYTYLGTNGTIVSPVHLEDIYYTLRYKLTATPGKVLTKDYINFTSSVLVGEDEVNEWHEIIM